MRKYPTADFIIIFVLPFIFLAIVFGVIFFQYYKHVKISDNTQKTLSVADSRVSDSSLEKSFSTEGSALTIKLNVDIYKDDKKIFSKAYDEKLDAGAPLSSSFAISIKESSL